MDFRLLEKYQPQLLSVLRIVAALVFMEHGTAKLFHFPVPQPGAPHPLPPLLLAAALIELIGGTLLTLGLFTRLIAFITAGEMAVAYFMAHFPKSVWPLLNLGAEAILLCFIFLYIAAAGPGAWSLDHMRMKKPLP